MKLRTTFLAIAFSMSAGAALAACPDGKAQAVDPGKTAAIAQDGIAKDGTHSPLETPDRTAAANPAQKDGKTMPLEGQAGGTDKNLATSQQDVEAQQQGDKTAVAQAEDECK